MSEYVIIGNGTAAVACVEGIRSVDKEGGITVVSAEKYAAYCRPLISYYLGGKTDEKRMQYRAESFYADNKCDVKYGQNAVKLDGAAKTVTLESGETLKYDKLCVATGSSPFVPPMEGLDKVEYKYGFLTMDDAKALKAAADPEKEVLIIGAGLIGLKCMEGLYNSVKHITVVDLADRVLSSILDADGAALVQKKIEEKGVDFLLSDSVARFEGNTAVMKSGKTVTFDLLVTAVGVRANMGLVKEAGGVCGRAIAVDDEMKTSIPDVYAAGDCTEYVDITDGQQKIMALMPNAYMQGFGAGVNMAGGQHRFDNAIPMNAIGFFGYHIMTAGSKDGLICSEVTEQGLKKLYGTKERLTGFEIVGDVKRTGIYTSLIRNKTDISTLQPEQLEKVPDLYMFEPETRKKMLGGVV